MSELLDRRLAEWDSASYALGAGLRERTLSPTLVVHLDRVRENVQRVLAQTGSPERWRPHVKTTKIPAVWAELVRAGVRNFKCATTREAKHLLGVLDAEGVAGGDVLLAYPLLGPALERLARLASEHPRTRVSVLCEDPALAAELPEPLTLFVDVNPGMHRTGVPVQDLESLVAICAKSAHRFRGVHWYDGHLHDGTHAERRARAWASYHQLLELLPRLPLPASEAVELITSGTPTFQHALAYEPFGAEARFVHRVSPGTVVYHDARSAEENEHLDLLPAAVVFTRVISHPRADMLTCDAGSKSVAAEAGDPCAYALGHPELVAQPPSEEHLPFLVQGRERPARGTALMLFPRHVCPTVNLAEEALLVEAGKLIERVAVSARAHDVWV